MYKIKLHLICSIKLKLLFVMKYIDIFVRMHWKGFCHISNPGTARFLEPNMYPMSDMLVFLQPVRRWLANMMTLSNGNIFRVTGHLCGEFTGPRWIPRKGQWRGALMFSLICARINGWVNNREADDLRRLRAHYDVIVTKSQKIKDAWRQLPCF